MSCSKELRRAYLPNLLNLDKCMRDAGCHKGVKELLEELLESRGRRTYSNAGIRELIRDFRREALLVK